MKKVSVLGFGYVGKAMYNFFNNHYDVNVYDPYKNYELVERLHDPDNGLIQLDKRVHNNRDIVNESDVAIICVPTPRDEKTGECDLTAVHETFEWINTPLVILKSTVEIGTTDKLKKQYPHLNIVFSPEFAGESTYWSEHKFHNSVVETPWFIFGGEKKDTTKAVNMYMKICGPTKTYLQCEPKEAEMTKYITNVFYATKVLFCYEMDQLCKKLDIDYNTVRSMWLQDPRINPMHTSVFEENERPFSGKCVLPNAKLKLENGDFITIKDYYDNIEKYNDKMILSTNYDCSKYDMKHILRSSKRYIDEEIYEFETVNGIFSCTGDHLMPINRNGKFILIKAQDINENDEFFVSDIINNNMKTYTIKRDNNDIRDNEDKKE